MGNHVFNIVLLVSFLLINFIIGVKASKKVYTMKEYVLGGGSFGIISIFFTLFSTDIGGTAVLSGTEFFTSAKLIDTLIEAFYPIFPSLIIAFLIIPRFRKNNNWLTIGDMMSSFYGKYAGVATGIFGAIHSIFCAGIELFALKTILELFFNISSNWGVLIIGIFLAVYSTLGGIKSIASTDIFKFIIFMIGIPMIAYLISTKAGGIASVLNCIPANKFEEFNSEVIVRNFSNITFGLFPVCLTCPFVIQRILMAKNSSQLKGLYSIYGLIGSIFSLVLILIAYSALKLNPSIRPNEIISFAINGCLPNSLKGLAMVALVAIVISSVDSLLHIAGVTVVHDVILPLLKEKNNHFSNNELKYSRISTVIVSIISIIVSLRATEAMSLLAFVFFFTAPITLLPIIAGIIGLKTNTKPYYYAAAATMLAYGYTTFFLPQEYANFRMLIHVLTNGIVFFGFLMIQNGGKIVFRDEYRINNTNENKKSLTEKITTVFSFPLHLAEYSRKKVDEYGAPYVLFAAFCLINYVLPFFLWTSGEPKYNTEILWIRFIGGILLCFLLVKEKWPKFLEPYLPIFWHFVLAYTLAFTNTIMFFATHGSIEWLINIALSIIFLIALVDWVSFFIISILGIGVGFLVFYYLIGEGVILNLSFETKYLLFYQIIFGTIIGLLFARKKQKKVKELEKGRDSAEELYDLAAAKLDDKEFGPLRIAKSLGNSNLNILGKLRDAREAIRSEEPEIAEEYMDMLESDLLNVIINEEKCLKLEVKEIDVKELTEYIESICKNKYGDNIYVTLRVKAAVIICDKLALSRILSQAFEKIKTGLSLHGRDITNTSIAIDISDTKLHYYLTSIKEYSKTIQAVRFAISTTDPIDPTLLKEEYSIELPDLFDVKPNNQDTTEKLAAEKYLTAHGGLCENIKSHGELINLYIIPQNVYDIRPKGLDSHKTGKNIISFWREATDKELLLKQELEYKSEQVEWENIKKALDFTRKYYNQKQLNSSGEPFHLHTIAVVRIMLEIITTYIENIKYPPNINGLENPLVQTYFELRTRQEAIIIATILHNVLEDSASNPTIIETVFGYEVAIYVLGITRIKYSELARNFTHEHILKSLLTQDPIPVCIKIADKLYSLYTIDGNTNEENRRKIAQETLDFFITPTKNLGFDTIAKDLENASNHILKHGRIGRFKFESKVLDVIEKRY